MHVKSMKQMWQLLNAYTLNVRDEERAINHQNEWGGYSRRLGMPVFTAWLDLTQYDKATKTVRALVSDATWPNTAGVNNQEHWLKHAEKNGEGRAAFFIIHAVDPAAVPRDVKEIDADVVFIGKIERDGTKTYISGERTPLDRFPARP
jgi:hypothetical protein